MTHLNVAVRVRPLSRREIALKSVPVVEINDNIVSVTNLKVHEQNAGDSRERVRRFSFDYCFDRISTQQEIFQSIDGVIGNAVRKKYHSCILAYGQSSSGKTHTMMGSADDSGLIPRLCENIFDYLKDADVEEEEKKVTVSYLEIYNEKVNDLLISGELENSSALKIREHPNRGTYVQGLTERPVEDSAALLNWLHVGNRKRRISATSVNPKSSRSHSVFIITCFGGVKLNLVDLAGSERTGSRSYTTSTFREGANINKSLVALGNVISALADQSTKNLRGFRKRFIPYRDSVLTWLLKDTLGGNSKTVLIATISASSTCYNETVNTLRFGHRAKQIISQPMVNEDPRQKTIRELKAEISRLRELLANNKVHFKLDESAELEPTHELEKNPKEQQSEISESAFKKCKITVDGSTNTENCYVNGNFKDLIFEQFKNKQFSDDAKILQTNSGQFLDLKHKNNTKIVGCTISQICKISANYNGVYLKIPETLTKVLAYIVTNQITIPINTKEFNLVGKHHLTKRPKKEVLCLKTEKLLPVMDINCDTSDKPIVKLRRTFSVCSTDMDPKNFRLYGSHEVLSSASAVKPEKMKKSQSTTLRKRSLDKSTSSIRSLLLKKAQEKSNLEQAKDGKNLTKVEAKVDSIRKASVKPRSEIVAAVTQRLYSKIKKKEVATETDEVLRENKGTLARMRLQDMTQRALKAHRRKNTETQTEFSPILRVKETSTDVSDLQIDLLEVKHANVSTEELSLKDASIGCNFLDNMASFDTRLTLKLTKSCGTQAGEETTTNQNPTSLISFTKYLRSQQESKFEIRNPANPIYASAVNINVSHNYINGSKTGSVSDDSLEETSSVCLPTPDLISNHNSLEPHVAVESTKADRCLDRLAYATTNDIPSFTTHNEYKENQIERNFVQSTTVPDCKERLQTIDIQQTYAPEICLTKTNEHIKPFTNAKPHSSKANTIEPLKSYDSVLTREPLVLKSIMKQSDQKFEYDSDSTDISLHTFDNVPDSLTYHTNKKVQFTQQPSEHDRLFEVMTNFLKEATNLMTNLTVAASQLDKSSQQTYDMQITVNDLSELMRRDGRRRKRTRRRAPKKEEIGCQTSDDRENVSSQTSPKRTFEISTETEHVPENRFENLVKNACYRLERCTERRRNERDSSRFAQSVFASSDAEHSSLQYEDSSLESNPTFSDYGSLPRKRIKNKYSPSAYLKQLTTMRKHIVDFSRDELINDH